MHKLEQQIKLSINNKIIEKNNIIELATYILTLRQDNDKAKVRFYIDFIDDFTLSSENLDIFENRLFEEKEIKVIRMKYQNYNLENFLSVYLYNYDITKNSRIELESKDENWIFTTKGKIEQLLSFCNNQSPISNLLINHFKIYAFIMVIASFVSSLFTIIFLRNVINWDLQQSFLMVILVMMLFIMIYSKLFEKLEKAYPLIEIAIKDKNNMAKKRRKIITLIISLIILPLMLSVLYDIVKEIVL